MTCGAANERTIMNTTLDETHLKKLFKTAMAEVLEENRELLREVIEEALEDIALARAIEEGLKTESVPRDEVFSVLEGAQ